MFIENEILPGIERGEEWHWTLRLKAEPERHIRVISLHRDEWDNRGYWLGVPWHRQGLMTEAVIAVNDYWFDVLGFTVLRAPKAVPNVASRRISEKTGMRVIATSSATMSRVDLRRKSGKLQPRNGARRERSCEWICLLLEVSRRKASLLGISR